MATKWQMILAFCFGCVFIVICLLLYLLVLFIPPTADIIFVHSFLDALRIVLALAAAGVASVIPGFLELLFKTQLSTVGNIGVRAGGAIAVFALIYLYNPAEVARVSIDEKLERLTLVSQCLDRTSLDRGSSTFAVKEGALEKCFQLITRFPEAYEGYYGLARINFVKRDYAGMATNMELAVEKYPRKEMRVIVEDSKLGKSSDFSLIRDVDDLRLIYDTAKSWAGVERFIDHSEDRAVGLYSVARDASTNIKGASESLAIDIDYDMHLHMLVLWMKDRSIFDPKYGARIKSAFDAYIVDGLGHYPRVWAFYHKACFILEDTGNHSKDEIAVNLIKEGVYELKNDKRFADYSQKSLMWLRYYLTGAELPRDPRVNDPIMCTGVRELAARNADYSRWLREVAFVFA